MLVEWLKGFRSLVQGKANPWDFADRRKLVRIRCRYETRVVWDGHVVEATVLDMGLGGLRIRLCRELKVGDKLVVNSPKTSAAANNQPVPCQVVWIRKADSSYNNYVGLRYDADEAVMGRTWVKFILKELGFKVDFIYSKRKYVRAECLLEGEITTVDPPKTHQIRIWNVGVKGILFEFRQALPLNQTVQLKVGPFERLPAFRATGRLAQVRPEGRLYLYGLEFEEIGDQDTTILGRYLKLLLSRGKAAE